MKSSPLFSILVANYNNSRYLPDCIESIFNQKYSNWEVIFVDDSSSDASLDTIYQLCDSDKRFKIFQNKENQGCGYTKNRCVSEATGAICGFLDPDDALSPLALIEMVQAHEQNPTASMTCSRHFVCNKNLTTIGLSPQIKIDDSGSLLAMPWAVSHFTAFKKAAYDKTDGINPLMKRAVDQDLYLKLEEIGEIAFIDSVLYYLRRNQNSISLNENQYKAIGWHLFATMEACKRRNLDFDDYCALLKSGKIKKIIYDPVISMYTNFGLVKNLIMHNIQDH